MKHPTHSNEHLFRGSLTRLRRGGRRDEGAVWQQVLQVFHHLVGAVCVVPSVLFLLPSLDGQRCRGRQT